MFHIVLVLLCCLILVFIALVSYTFWTRARNQLWNRYRDKFRDLYLTELFHFVETAKQPEDAEKLLARVKKRTRDLVYFLELIEELSDIMKGEENEKLVWLIKRPLFHSFYSRKIFSRSGKNQLLSCLYFEKCGVDDERVTGRLNTLSQSGNVKLAYAATKALQSSGDISVRESALIRFLKRNDASSLMFGELIHIFYRDGEKLHAITSMSLKEMLARNDLPPDRKRIIVIYFAEQNFYEYSEFLYEYFKKLTLSKTTKPLIIALIKALGELEILESSSDLMKYARNRDPEVRLASIKALNHMGETEHLQFIQKRIIDMEFEIRKEVIEILVQHPGTGHTLLQNILLQIMYYINNIRLVQNPSGKELNKVKVINSITTGIRILTNKKIRPVRY
ncbi:HEAT repeat domain-containing protein [Rhodohalobacter sp. SW132]|uniref:HEAT repeat domain-containing protein n=1 Tax=Rhodohalobacter sp. SW132 TaxID=2293433 RepID=UPI000E231F9E|nr:HEAT repeat domain-containing protein [Rhodohalobacter sp. SW132]